MERLTDPLTTTDAKLWADEFMKVKARLGEQKFDHAMMLGWFANAIMVGYDEGSRRAKADAQATVEALQAQHKDLVLRNKILRDRLDLPTERCTFHDEVEALQKERDEAIREHGKESGFWGRTCARLLDKRDKLQTALDDEREKVKGLERELASYKAGTDGEYGDRIRTTLDTTTPAAKGGDGE